MARKLGEEFIKRLPVDGPLPRRTTVILKQFTDELDMVTSRDQLRDAFKGTAVLKKLLKQSGVQQSFWQNVLRELERLV